MKDVPTITEVRRTPWSGDLAFMIECRHARNATSGDRHEVIIHADWTVTTPHDMTAERVAMAFGGYTSCLELVDQTIPRLRESMSRVARRTRPMLRRDKRREWRVPTLEMAACCRGRAFLSVLTIVEHLRSPKHLASLHALPLWQVETIVQHVSRACRPNFTSMAPQARYVREPQGPARLWRAGVHPDEIPLLASYAAAVGEPLPCAYYEGVVYSGHDPGWINEVLENRPDADTAAWLAWQAPPDGMLADVTELGRWLGYGLSRSDFAIAVERLVPADSIPEVARATGWSVRTAARVVLGFAKADCRPTPEMLGTIAGLRVEYTVPGMKVVDAAVADAHQLGTSIERTELGVMLALSGSRPALLSAIRSGARNAGDLLPQWASDRPDR